MLLLTIRRTFISSIYSANTPGVPAILGAGNRTASRMTSLYWREENSKIVRAGDRVVLLFGWSEKLL